MTRAAWRLSETEIAVGFVGRISRETNCETIPAAVEQLGPPFRAVLIGPTYDRGYADTVRSSGPNALFVPPVGHVGDALAALDCLVLASPAEGGPLIVLEAMLAGVPVVATPVGLLPGMASRFGELFASVPIQSGPTEFAAAINRAVSPNWREAIPPAQQVVRDSFSAQHMADQWAHYLEEIVHEELHR